MEICAVIAVLFFLFSFLSLVSVVVVVVVVLVVVVSVVAVGWMLSSLLLPLLLLVVVIDAVKKSRGTRLKRCTFNCYATTIQLLSDDRHVDCRCRLIGVDLRCVTLVV